MNTNFVHIIKNIVAAHGETILAAPQKLKGVIHTDARNIAPAERLAFGRCIEQGYYRVLKQTTSAEERARIKPQIARQMSSISKLELPLCAEAVDVLEAVLYGTQTASVPAQTPVVQPVPKLSTKPPIRLTRKTIIAISAAAAAAALVVIIAIGDLQNGTPQTEAGKQEHEPNDTEASTQEYEPNDFEYELQWLTVEIACLGKYSSAQAGDYTLEDPHDYYTPELINKYLANKSGKRTMTKMIYGVCFDYAQLCWDELREFKNYYNDLGVENYWIAGVNGEADVLTICDPVTDPQKSTFQFNGVLLEEVRKEKVRAHGDAAWHAWIWIKHKNGKIYWIDPTWTDNTGRVIWGYVDKGREIELPPADDLCVQS
jgi:hypothetical protein